MEQRGLPAAGEFYEDEMGKAYQVIGRAYSSETGEEMLVYQELFGNYYWYVRPLREFLEPVDYGRRSSAAKPCRFERVARPGGVKAEKGTAPAEGGNPTKGQAPQEAGGPKELGEMEEAQEAQGQVRAELLWFLDAETAKEKLTVLRRIRAKLDEQLITNIELSLDLMPDEKEPMERRVDLIERNLEKRVKYECSRLR